MADGLLARIVAGRYPSGLRLPAEVELAEEFSCARSTLREALRHLAGLGVVRSRRGSGALVLDFRREGTPALLPHFLVAGGPPSPVLARELLHLRSLLATEAVRLAARYASVGSLVEARRVLAAAPAVEADPVAHALTELDLFRALVVASGVWPAVWLANAFWAPMRELYDLLAPWVGRVPRGWQRHMEGLIDRIERGDADAAVEHVAGWLARVDERLLSDLDEALVRLGAADGAAASREVAR